MFTFGLSPDQFSEDLSVKRLEWTTTPPTEPGWYWVYYVTEGPQTQVVEVRESWEEPGARLVVISPGDYQECELETFTHWLGPLPEPEPPKE